MRILRAIGAPAAIFGYLLHLLLPVTTALAYDAGARSDIPEICTLAGVKRAPTTLAEAQDNLALSGTDAGKAADDKRPAQHPSYCPGSAPVAALPTPALSLSAPALVRILPAPAFHQHAGRIADPGAGPSQRGPPLPV